MTPLHRKRIYCYHGSLSTDRNGACSPFPSKPPRSPCSIQELSTISSRSSRSICNRGGRSSGLIFHESDTASRRIQRRARSVSAIHQGNNLFASGSAALSPKRHGPFSFPGSKPGASNFLFWGYETNKKKSLLKDDRWQKRVAFLTCGDAVGHRSAAT